MHDYDSTKGVNSVSDPAAARPTLAELAVRLQAQAHALGSLEVRQQRALKILGFTTDYAADGCGEDGADLQHDALSVLERTANNFTAILDYLSTLTDALEAQYPKVENQWFYAQKETLELAGLNVATMAPARGVH